MGAAITGWGCAVPEKRLTNAELADDVDDLTEEWIVARTGIKERRIAAREDSSSSLAVDAARSALAVAEVDPADLDMIIVATITPDFQFPATASVVQTALGSRAGAFDLGAGCAGFLFALAQGAALVDSGASRRVLVCGSDVLSRFMDYSDPKTSVLFGDGAGAVVLEARPGPSRIGPFKLYSDGARPELLWIPPGDRFLRMKGREVYRYAVDGMARAVRTVLDEAGMTAAEAGVLIAHQANARILDAVASRLDWPKERIVSNIDRYGNTSSASIPIAICETVERGMLVDGDPVVMTAFGAGFAWGAGLVAWGAGAGPETAGVGEREESLLAGDVRG
ncbi:beta-ketoacyl-ACP synthase III [soil metagenome]